MSVLDPNPLCAPGAVAGAGNAQLQGWPNDEFHAGRRMGWEHSRDIRWVQAWNTWAVYSGGRWKREDREQSKSFAKMVCARQIADHGEGARTASFIKNVLTQAKDWLALTPEDFDNDPLLLNCEDGVLSLRRENCGTLLAHSPDYLLTQSTGVSLRRFADEKGVVWLGEDWGYDTSEWECHLDYMVQNLGREQGLEFREFFQRWSGVALIGSQSLKPQHFLNLTGSGRNGKGVSAEARLAALGDYGYTAPIRVVTRRQSDHSTETAGLEGKRLVVVEEVGMVQAAVIKDLTGGGTITARRMRQDDVSFQKTWTMELLSNAPINLQGESSKAIRRRKIVAHLGDEVPSSQHRDGIVEALRAEADLILCWMADGLRKWYADGGKSAGLAIPRWMEEAGEMESDDDDVIGALIAERYEKCEESECKIVGSQFVKEVNERRKDSGFLPLTPAAIYSYLRENGYPVKVGSRNRTMVWGLRTAEMTFADLQQMAGHYN